jgi:ArsR family transcriptional regulator, arsenate/arsenite/antimonite-responsive transcriptional repressor
MGLIKTESFTEQENQMANLFKSLSHPARIAILNHLLAVDHCITTDIVNELPLAQPTVSQHLKALREANIIKGTIEGTTVCYCINEKIFTEFEDFFQKVVNGLKNKCC